MNLILIGFSYLLVIGLVFFESVKKKVRLISKSSDNLVWLIFPLLLLFRDRGWDYQLYVEMYEAVAADNIFVQWTEPGFLILMLIAKVAGLNFNEFNFVIGFINLFIIKKACEYFNVNQIMVLFLFIIFYYIRFPYGQIRQSLAIGLFIYSLTKLKDSNISFVVINLFASMIHSSAILAFPFLMLYKAIVEKKIFFNVIVILVGVGVFFVIYQNSLAEQFYEVYAKYEYYLGLVDQKKSILISTQLPLIVLTLISLCLLRITSKVDLKFKVIEIAYVFGVLIFLIFSDDLRFSERVSSQFLILTVFVLAKASSHIKHIPRLIVYSLFLLMGVIYLWNEFEMLKAQQLNYYW